MRSLLGTLLCCSVLACSSPVPNRPPVVDDAGAGGSGGSPAGGNGGSSPSGGSGGSPVQPPVDAAPAPTPPPVDAAPAPPPTPPVDAAVPPDLVPDLGPPDAGGGNALLFVIGAVGTFVSDATFVQHLTGKGFSVQVKTDAEVTAADAVGRAAILLSGSTSLATITASFPQLPTLQTPVIVMDENLEPFMNMVGNGAAERGTTDGTQVNIPGNAEDDLTAGLSGNVTIYSAEFDVSWGVPEDAALRGATIPGNNNQLALYAYRAGAEMANDATAPAKRVFFFMRDSPTPDLLTDDGFKLFDAAVAFATKP